VTTLSPIGRQAEVVRSSESQLLVVAPPGCGKTELIAMRAEYLVRNGLIRPHRRLLAVTYSKRARDTMAQRIQARLGYRLTRQYVTVQNFHGLAGRIVRSHATTIGLPTDLSFPTKRWFSHAIAAATPSWDERAAVEATLRRLKAEPLDDEEIDQRLGGAGDELARAVERARRRERHLDYPDLLRHAQRLLHHPSIARLYQEHFDAVLVDEFQDMSLQQLDIVSRVCRGAATFVGDPLQGIYSFAGAEPSKVEAELMWRPAHRIDLDVSYRSSPQVLQLVNAIASPLGAQELRAADPAAWEDRGAAAARVFINDQAEAEWIAEFVSNRIAEDPNESIGVIARRGSRRKLADRAITQRGLQPQVWDIALDTPGLASLLKAAARSIAPDQPIADQLEALQQRALVDVAEDDVDTTAEVIDAIAVLSERADEGESIRNVLERIRDVEQSEVVPPGVHLLNAHIGKGQQFDWVIVLGLEEGHVPDFRSADDPEEQRVLMVMLSRAKRGLVVTRARSTTTAWGFRDQRPSRWWSLLETAAR
jgi:DNA helicase-2/ATP-dependent DNA helicase PcrA